MQLFMLPSCLKICAKMKMVERPHTLEFSEVRGLFFIIIKTVISVLLLKCGPWT